MKVLLLVDRLDIAGGLERSLANKVQTWCEEGRDVHIATIDQQGSDYYAIDARAVRSSLNIHYDRETGLLAIANLWRAVRHFVALRRVYRQARPTHVVHSGYGFDFYFLPLIARSAFLIKENHSSRYRHEGMTQTAFNHLKDQLRIWFDSRYDASVFLSNEEAELSRLRNTVVIPNALEKREFQECLTRRKQVISAGRICTVKGFDRLIEAWALAAPQLPDWHLNIYGDGTPADVADLQNKISSLGLSECVSLHPATLDIIERMAESRIYAMTSRSECFPMVLLEAMQAGLPIVAYNCPTGPRNIVVHNDTGVLVPDGDATGFADALVRLASDPDAAEAIARNARRESQRYSSGDIASKWSALFSRGRIR